MIRLAQASDLDRILQITRLCAREMGNQEKFFNGMSTITDRQSFVRDIRNSELYVYCTNDMVVGCISICSLMDEVYRKVSWKTNGKNSVYIHRLAVEPGHQKQGSWRQVNGLCRKEIKIRWN